jgi:hypothetical protein
LRSIFAANRDHRHVLAALPAGTELEAGTLLLRTRLAEQQAATSNAAHHVAVRIMLNDRDATTRPRLASRGCVEADPPAPPTPTPPADTPPNT